MIVYECPSCEREETASPYRMTCRNCGATLRSVGTRHDDLHKPSA